MRRNSSRCLNKKVLEADEEFHPKILRKPETTKSEIILDNNEVPLELPLMARSVTIINKNYVDASAISSFVNQENNNFYVVGVIGMKDSGKTTLLNLIASGIYKHEKDSCPVFNELIGGNGIEAFITSNRMILLDSGAISHNTNAREFINSEADDFRQIQALFKLCHELLIVFESHQVMNLIRMIVCAKNMMRHYECDEPVITLVENRTQPGTEMSQMTKLSEEILNASHISNTIYTLQLPDIAKVQSHHGDPLEIINKLREDINTRKELKSFEEDSETEKLWLDKLSKLNMEGGELLKLYEGLREKFYVPHEL